MAEYKIVAISQEPPRVYDTKYGQMVSYKIKLEGVALPVELGQKVTTPAPQVGAVLNGHIEETPYGPKFKKEQAQFGGGSGFTQSPTSSSSAPRSTGSSKSFDSFTMYLSYAKDVAVACVEKGKFDEELYATVLDAVVAGGKTLYDNRPGAEPAPVVEKPADVVPTEADLEAVRDAFGETEQVNLGNIPF